MSDTPGGWPAWARYAVFAGLGAVVVLGLVAAAAGGQVQGATVRILLAAVVVPALLLPLQLVGLRRRADRSRGRLHQQLAELGFLLTSERDAAPAARATGASDETLARVADQVEIVRALLRGAPGDQIAEQVDRLVVLTRPWPADAPAARAVAQCGRSARTLAVTARRGSRRTRTSTGRDGVTSDGRAFRVQPRWKEEVVYWEGARGFVFDAGWGVEPPVLYVPSGRMWDDVVPDWMRGRRAAVVAALQDHSGHVLHEDDHGWYRSAPESRVIASS